MKPEILLLLEFMTLFTHHTKTHHCFSHIMLAYFTFCIYQMQ